MKSSQLEVKLSIRVFCSSFQINFRFSKVRKINFSQFGRSQVVRFTIPYFYSGFAIMVAKKPPSPQMFAFLKPLHPQVWLFIFVAMNTLALVKACCEWFSPYGLNPANHERGAANSEFGKQGWQHLDPGLGFLREKGGRKKCGEKR